VHPAYLQFQESVQWNVVKLIFAHDDPCLNVLLRHEHNLIRHKKHLQNRWKKYLSFANCFSERNKQSWNYPIPLKEKLRAEHLTSTGTRWLYLKVNRTFVMLRGMKYCFH